MMTWILYLCITFLASIFNSVIIVNYTVFLYPLTEEEKVVEEPEKMYTKIRKVLVIDGDKEEEPMVTVP